MYMSLDTYSCTVGETVLHSTFFLFSIYVFNTKNAFIKQVAIDFFKVLFSSSLQINLAV